MVEVIKELLDGLKSRLKGVGEKGGSMPPAGGIPLPAEHAAPAPGAPAPAAPTAPTSPPAPSTEDFSALLGGGDTSELDNKVKALEDKTTRLESTVKETLDITKSNANRLDNIDLNMKKFISLYELVTNQINPFVESTGFQKPLEDRKLPRIEDKIEVKTEGTEEDKIIVPSADELIKEESKAEEPITVAEAEPSAPPPPKIPMPGEKKPAPQADTPNDSEQVMFMQSVKDGTASFVLEWITSLVTEDGNIEKNTKLLKYLLELGWITPKAYEALMQHMQVLAAAGKMPQKQMMPVAIGAQTGGGGIPQMPTASARFPPQMPPFPSGGGSNADSLLRVLEWVKYLVDKVGYIEAIDILKYLVQLGWITPEAHTALLRYIDKSLPPQARGERTGGTAQFPGEFKPESKVFISPDRIPRPEDFMAEYRIPVQPTATEGETFPVMPAQYMRETQPREQYRERPFKRQKPSPESAIIPLTELGSDIESLAIVLEWIRYLVDRAGTQGATGIFSYYANIGWVDQRVCQQLVKYVDGIKAQDEETVGYQPTVEDHATSLFFISKLKHLDLTEEDINSMLGK